MLKELKFASTKSFNMPPILRVQFRPLLGGDWGEVRFTIKIHFIIIGASFVFFNHSLTLHMSSQSIPGWRWRHLWGCRGMGRLGAIAWTQACHTIWGDLDTVIRHGPSFAPAPPSPLKKTRSENAPQVKISGRNSEGYSQFSRPVTYATPSQGKNHLCIPKSSQALVTLLSMFS